MAEADVWCLPISGGPEVEDGGSDAVPDVLEMSGQSPDTFCDLQPRFTTAGELRGLWLSKAGFVLSFGKSFKHRGLDYGACCFHLP